MSPPTLISFRATTAWASTTPSPKPIWSGSGGGWASLGDERPHFTRLVRQMPFYKYLAENTSVRVLIYNGGKTGCALPFGLGHSP